MGGASHRRIIVDSRIAPRAGKLQRSYALYVPLHMYVHEPYGPREFKFSLHLLPPSEKNFVRLENETLNISLGRTFIILKPALYRVRVKELIINYSMFLHTCIFVQVELHLFFRIYLQSFHDSRTGFSHSSHRYRTMTNLYCYRCSQR